MTSHTAYSTDARQTLDEKDRSRIDLYTDHMIDVAPKLKTLDIKYLAANSYYSKAKFVHAVTKLNLHIVGKLRIDANLKWLYDGEYTGSGRPRKYDGKVDFKKDINRFEYIETLNGTTHVYSTIVHSMSLKKDIRIALLTPTQPSTQGRGVFFRRIQR